MGVKGPTGSRPPAASHPFLRGADPLDPLKPGVSGHARGHPKSPERPPRIVDSWSPASWDITKLKGPIPACLAHQLRSGDRSPRKACRVRAGFGFAKLSASSAASTSSSEMSTGQP